MSTMPSWRCTLWYLHLTVCTLFCSAQSSSAGNTNRTSDPQSEFIPSEDMRQSFATRNEDPETGSFWRRYPREVQIVAEARALDSFGYPAHFEIVRRLETEGYGFHAYAARRGRAMVVRSLAEGAREAASASVNTEEIMSGTCGRWGAFFGNLFHGSLGDTEEGRINIVSPVPSAASTRELALEWENSTGTLSYGLRPFRGQPYAYVSGRLFGSENRSPILARLRVLSETDPHDGGRITVAPQIILPLRDRSHIVCGASIYPTRFGDDDGQPAGSVRWESLRWGGITYAGVSSGPRETLCLIGFANEF